MRATFQHREHRAGDSLVRLAHRGRGDLIELSAEQQCRRLDLAEVRDDVKSFNGPIT
jgi:hypothetical protein